MATGTGGAGIGGSGGGSIIMPGDAATQGDGSVLSRDAACVSDAQVGEKVPVDLYFMVDKTGSMNCPLGPSGATCPPPNALDVPPPPPGVASRWTEMAGALKAFTGAAATAGMGMGIAFFPKLPSERQGPIDFGCVFRADCHDCGCVESCGCFPENCRCDFSGCADGGSCLGCTCYQPGSYFCEPSDYEMPAVEVASLPAVGAKIAAAIDAQKTGGGTPTFGSLSGALKHARDWALAHPDHRTAIVYATDGEPAGCGDENTIQGAVAVARGAVTGTPSIPIYVLGVGPNLDNLNQIAAAGGTDQAYLVDTGADVSQKLAMALDSIRNRTLSCNYAIPASPRGPLDFGAVNVVTQVGANGMPTVVKKVANQADCRTTGGWYYDDNAAPKSIILCPASCGPLLDTSGSRLDVLIGCKTEIEPPR
jgi:hypothetical protein